MRIYLDTCAIQRPLDDQNQPSIRIDGDIILTLIESIELGNHVLVTSSALRFETDNIPKLRRRNFCKRVLALASINQNINPTIALTASRLEQHGFKPMDAVHIASAISSNSQIMCSVDKLLLRKAKKVNTGTLEIVSPAELKEKLSL